MFEGMSEEEANRAYEAMSQKEIDKILSNNPAVLLLAYVRDQLETMDATDQWYFRNNYLLIIYRHLFHHAFDIRKPQCLALQAAIREWIDAFYPEDLMDWELENQEGKTKSDLEKNFDVA